MFGFFTKIDSNPVHAPRDFRSIESTPHSWKNERIIRISKFDILILPFICIISLPQELVRTNDPPIAHKIEERIPLISARHSKGHKIIPLSPRSNIRVGKHVSDHKLLTDGWNEAYGWPPEKVVTCLIMTEERTCHHVSFNLNGRHIDLNTISSDHFAKFVKLRFPSLLPLITDLLVVWHLELLRFHLVLVLIW